MARSAAVLASALVAVLPLALEGQQRSTIVVRVRSSLNLGPLPDARVKVRLPSGTDTTVVTDTTGRYEFRRLQPGSYVLSATWRELASHEARINLADREQVEVEFTVGPLREPTLLPDLAVGAPPGSEWLSRFEARRAAGIGQFITREEIESRPLSSVGSLMLSLRGVALRCAGTRGCVPYFTRAPPSFRPGARGGCMPLYFIDEAPADAEAFQSLLMSDIEAIEAYQGLAQIPLDLLGDPRQGRCGVIIVWTRRPGIPRPPN